MSGGIVWMDGDPPGAELLSACQQVFHALGLASSYESHTARIGWHLSAERLEPLPQDSVRPCADARCVFVGALGSGPVGTDLKSRPGPEFDPLARLRKELALPVQLVELERSGPESESFELDIIAAEPTQPEAVQQAVRLAFGAARRRSRPQLTLVSDQPGPLAEQARLLQREVPEAQFHQSRVFEYCSALLERPSVQSVALCAPTVFPAIAAIGAHRVGGAFGAATAFVGGRRACFTTLQPARQSYSGAGRNNPLGALRALRLMLSFLDETAAATRLDGAIQALLAEGPRTVEQGGDALGEDATRFVVAWLARD